MKTQMTIATLVLALATTAVQAQTGRHRHRESYEAPYSYVVPTQVCQKMCPNDFAPCDPLYFKTADGRCAGIMPGR